MEGTDRLNELRDEMLVNNVMSHLECTTKELIKTTATISKRWNNLLTQLPHLIFIDEDGVPDFGSDLHGYISFIDKTLNQCHEDLNLKKFKLDITYDSLVNSEFNSRANSWIRYAISLNVKEVDLSLFDVKVCSWQRFESLCLWHVTLDEDMVENILSGSPCLESLELNDCYGYRHIDVSSKSVKKLVFSGYFSRVTYEAVYTDCIKINAPYIYSLTIKDVLVLGELVLLDVFSLVKADLDYSIKLREYVIFEKEVFGGLLKSLHHVEDITLGDHFSELLSRLKVGSDTSKDDRAENGDREEQITSSD
ncbi:thiamine thiazole synthase, chloroplastic-like protein [Tanacetum coccineum]